MKITKRQLRRIIKEEIATVTDDAIEDVVMSVLGDEGGAAGSEPIEDALDDLEDDEISLPDEDIEDIIGDVTGVKRHADGDYIDTTQLEVRRVTRGQLRKIIKEEMLSERGTGNPALQSEERAIMNAVVSFVDKYRLTMGFDPNDFGDDKRVRQAVQDVIAGVLGEDM
jgi:hypothetical protein